MVIRGRSREEELYHVIFDSANEGILVLDWNGYIEDANPRFCERYGHSLEQIKGRHVKQLLHSDVRYLYDKYRSKMEEAGYYEGSALADIGKDKPVNLLVRASAIKSDDRRLVVVMVTDVTMIVESDLALQQSNEHFNRVFTLMPEVITISRLKDGLYIDVNDCMTSILGYTREDCIGKTALEIGIWTDPDIRQEVVMQLQQTGEVRNMEASFRHKNGSVLYGQVSARTFTYGNETCLLTVATDISKQKAAELIIRQQNTDLQRTMQELASSYEEAEAIAEDLRESQSKLLKAHVELQANQEQLAQSEGLYRAIFENTGTASIIIDEDTVISLANTEWVNLSGYSKGEIEGRMNIAQFVAPEDRERVLSYHHVRRLDPELAPPRYEFRFLRNNGEIKQVLCNTTMVPGTGRSIASLTDISEHKRLESELRTLATTDYLTGIYNRRTIMEMGRQEYDRARRYHEPLSLLMMDIDHFKLVNDNYGHAAGDAALISLVTSCIECLRGHDLLGRMGGEEFLIILPHTSLSEALQVAERLRHRVGETLILHDGTFFRITVSLGVSQLEASDINIEGLISKADNALYRAKQRGRNLVEIQ
ncbi:MAG: PAS domain S-box protein [Deltaproteobacteria bacterium]